MTIRKSILGGVLAIAVIAAIYMFGFASQKTNVNVALTKVKISLTAYPDTSLFLYGLDKGYFKEEGIDLELKSFPWNEQIEGIAGGGVDVAMATLDEVVAKSKNLNKVGKPIVYFLPAWQFEGTIFVAQKGITPLATFRKSMEEPASKEAFLKQLQGKLIASPESGMYDQAIRRFIRSSGKDPASFKFVNTQLETGINGLNDSNVGIAAAGGFERPEAARRGYEIALTPNDLDVIILTGFIAKSDFYKSNPDLFARFSRAWYKTVNNGLKDQETAYAIAKKYIDPQGAKIPPLQDYKSALAGNKFPRSPKDAYDLFYKPDSPSFWRRAWDRGLETLKEGGKQDQLPMNDDDFVALSLNKTMGGQK